MSNVRDICVELLTNVEKNQAYSTVAFQNVLQKHQLDARDRVINGIVLWNYST